MPDFVSQTTIPTFKIPKPPPLTTRQVQAMVEEGYTKEPLSRFYEAYLRDLFASRPASPHHNLRSNANKAAFVGALTAVFMQRDLFLELLDLLPEEAREAVWRIVWFGPDSVRRLATVLGAQIMETKQSQQSYYGYYTQVQLTPAFCLFMLDVSTYDSQTPSRLWRATCYLPLPIRKHLQSFLPTPTLLLPETKEPDAPFRYELSESRLAQLVRCALFLAEGHLEYTKTGKPRRADVRKMQTYCDIPEFFPETTGPYSFLATELLVDALQDTLTPEQGDADGLDLLHDVLVLDTEVDPDRSVADQYLSFLKRRDVLFDYDSEHVARVLLLALLSALPPHEWMAVDALVQYVRYHAFPIVPFSFSDARFLQLNGDVVVNYPLPAAYQERYYYYDDAYITADVYHDVTTRPVLCGYLARMAVLGVVDVAYDYPTNDTARRSRKEYLTEFDGIRYVRLNALGAYLAGYADTYDAPTTAVDTETTVVLDPNYLILTLDGNDKIKEMIAEQVGTALSPGRYRVDYASFLRDCSSRADVQNKVERFQRHLTAEVPERWAAFFKEVVRKVHPLREQPSSRVFKLDGDSELVRLFARDPVLQKYARKAEGHHVIIEDRSLHLVRKRLEKFGYLMPR